MQHRTERKRRKPGQRRLNGQCRLYAMVLALVLTASPALAADVQQLFLSAPEGPSAKIAREIPSKHARVVRLDETALRLAIDERHSLELNLFNGLTAIADFDRRIRNPSGSVSWVGRVRGDARGSVLLVHRDGITVGSVRAHGALYTLHYAGRDSRGQALHELFAIDENDPAYTEAPSTPVRLDPERVAAAERTARRKTIGEVPEDDGSIQDLMVVYTPAARDAVGGVVAIENLIDLGVTDTNLSYEQSGVQHRLRLVHTRLIDYDEATPSTIALRDRLRIKDDGHMDEVHPWRDEYHADLVKLMIAGGSCGRAHIMDEVSLAFEEFAFCYTRYVCVTPRYTFAHELGHVQGGRHRWGGDNTDNAPFTFNHGYGDPVAEFLTIMAQGQSDCADCPRLLYWSNPDVLEPQSGAPMGIPEGQPLAADNRKTLNQTAWTVANFRVDPSSLFNDGFEQGNITRWTRTSP